MASPLSATAFRDAIRHEGVTVVEVGSWRTHNRNAKGAWGPVHGVMIHHTVTSGTDRSVSICRDGYASLPGPLCHGVIDKAGAVHLVGYGRTNHAGSGDDDVLAAVVAERALPADNEANTDGNRHFYGFECVNLGDNADPWPEVQVEAIARAAAGVCREHGWDEGSVIGHSEWQPGKVDPRGPIGTKDGPALTMARIRARVAELLDDDTAPAPTKPKPSAPAKPTPPKFPGRSYFRAGADNAYVTQLGRQLVAKGYGKHYRTGPGPRWGEADRQNVEAFQRAQGWSGGGADGYPGPETWRRLFA